MDPQDVGRYGSLTLLKARADATVCSYPIDAELLTIGRDAACDIRLYYNAVSPLHCKVIFEERKAFLIVLGQEGLQIDSCPVFPAPPSASRPTTIPLSNNSLIEIHNKRFRFAYPPKELRAALIATPSAATPDAAPKRRALRLSMIQSALVFSPRPSKDPLENLRVLQSPLRPGFESPVPRTRRISSPLKHKGFIAQSEDDDEEDDEEEEEIILVEGNHPKVVQEEKDLIILEDVEPQQQKPNTTTPDSPPAPQLQSQRVLQTPRGKPGRPSLHRAVLIRSAQRAVLHAEMAREEEEEDAMEVEGIMEADEDEEETDPERGADDFEEESDGELSDEGEEEEEEEESAQMQTPKPKTWRKSLTDLWPFGKKGEDQPGEGDEDEVQEEVQDAAEAEANIEANDDDSLTEDHDTSLEEDQPEELEQSIQPRPLGRFMTPQRPRTLPPTGGPATVRSQRDWTPSGSSILLTPRRAEAPWKVRDIVVPLATIESSTTPSESPVRPQGEHRVSTEEAEAIRERRRSALLPHALRTPRAAAVSPLKSLVTAAPNTAPFARPSSPTKPEVVSSTLGRSLSSTKPASRTNSPRSPTKTSRSDVETDEEDTAVMLASMRRTVNNMRRRSLGRLDGLPPLSPAHPPSSSGKRGRFSLIARESEPQTGALDFGGLTSGSDDEGDSTDDERMEVIQSRHDEGDEGSDKENDMDPEHEVMDIEMEEDSADEESNDVQPVASSSHAVPQTPDLAGLRHVFGQPQDPTTPALSGMRELFKEPAAEPGTPAYEGLGDMLATPAAFRSGNMDNTTDVAKGKAVTANVKTKPAASRLPARAPKPRAPPARVAPPAPAEKTVADASMADDETTPAEPVVKRAPSRLVAPRAGVAKKAKDAEDAPMPTKLVKVTRTTARTTHTTTAVTVPEAESMPAMETGDVRPETRKPATRRTRAKSAEQETPVGPTRRATRATPAPEVEVSEPTQEPTDVKGKRVARAKATKAPKNEENETSTVPEPQLAQRTAAKRGAAASTRLPAPSATAATRTRASARKAAPVGTSEEATNKENTPESRDDDRLETPARTRATRSSSTKKAAAKTLVVKEEEPDAPKTTGRRTTRVRK